MNSIEELFNVCKTWFVELNSMYQTMIYCGIGYVVGLLLLYIIIRKYSVPDKREYKINKWLMMLPLYRTIIHDYVGVYTFTKVLAISVLFIVYSPIEVIYAPLHLVVRVLLFIFTGGQFRKNSNEISTVPESTTINEEKTIEKEEIKTESQETVAETPVSEAENESNNDTVVEADKPIIEEPSQTETSTVNSDNTNKQPDIRKQLSRKIVNINRKISNQPIDKPTITKINNIIKTVKENFVQSNNVRKAYSTVSQLILKSDVADVDSIALITALNDLKTVITDEKTKIKSTESQENKNVD